MPVTPPAPGVYREEIASGVHTITGAATSPPAVIGRARHGPVAILSPFAALAALSANWESRGVKRGAGPVGEGNKEDSHDHLSH